MKRMMIILLASLFFTGICSAQTQFPNAVWGADYYWSYSIVQTFDSRYAIAGRAVNFGGGYYDMFFVKLGIFGATYWGEEIFPTVTDAGPTVTDMSLTVTDVSSTVTDVSTAVTDNTPTVTEIHTYLDICPTIDSLWFLEEILHDGQNLVTICFRANDADGDSFLAEMSIFDGSVPVSIHTIYDTITAYPDTNLGWVQSGEHCFIWDMREDYPGFEGCDFDIEISIHNESTEILTVTDSFYLHDAEGIAWDGEYLWVSSSKNVTGDMDTLVVYKINPITHEILDSCVFNGTVAGLFADMCWHNDTIYMMRASFPNARMFILDPSTCAFVDSAGPYWATRWGQGITFHNGYFWLNDSRGLIYRVDSSPPYAGSQVMNLDSLFRETHGGDSLFYGAISADAIEFALGYMWILRNPGGGISHILFQFDTLGNVIDSFLLPSAGTHGPEGLTFDGSCFWYTDHSGDYVYRVCLWGCDDTLVVPGCLDSHDPEVALDISYCGDTLYVGDTASVSFDIVDSFFTMFSTPCSLWIACEGDTVFIGEFSDNPFDWTVPDLPCDTARLIFSTFDSFGNYGADTSCAFTIVLCAPANAYTVCPTAIAFNSCIDPLAYFFIEDTTGISIDTFRAHLTYSIYQFGILVDEIHIDSPHASIDWSGSGNQYWLTCSPMVSDGDSVIVTIDSLYNIAGCKIIP